MTSYLPTTPYRGTRDFLPDEMSVRDQTFRTLYDTIERFGYRKYDGPILESAEIYEAKSGKEIADLQLYTLTDRGGRQLALRPEMTPSVARMIAANANTLQFPVRWYSHPNCHRYERPQRGRVREHWQINVDIFGSDSWRCEVEIFELIHDMLASVGATRDMYVLRASDRVLLEGILRTTIGVPDPLIRPVSALIDRWEKVERDQLGEDAGQLGLSEDQFSRLETVLKSGPDVLADLPSDVLDRSHLINILRSEAGSLVTFDPLIVRAFEYYTSTVFEVFDNHPDNNRSIFGGGRYSDLVGLFCPNKIPGIGFGFGDVTLFNFLDTHELTPKPRAEVDVVVLPIDESLLDAARHVAGQLRAAGYRANSPFEARKLAKNSPVRARSAPGSPSSSPRTSGAPAPSASATSMHGARRSSPASTWSSTSVPCSKKVRMQQAKASMPDDRVPASSSQNVRSATEVLTAVMLARGRWLSAAVEALAISSFVDSAWLVGSLGSGTEDPYSDINLVVAAGPSTPPAVFSDPVGCLRLPGPVLYTCTKPRNAPAGGAYRAVCVELAGLPVLADLYLWPTATAAVPKGARILLKRAEPTHSPDAFMPLLDKHRTTDTIGADPTDPAVTLMLVQLAAKYLARNDQHRHAAIAGRLGLTVGAGTAALRETLRDCTVSTVHHDLRAAVAAVHRLVDLVDASRASAAADQLGQK